MGNKRFKLKKTNVFDYATYLFVIVVFVIVTALNSAGALNRSQQGWLVPACCYIVMAISLNLTVGIMGELSLGHAGFMSVGAFSGAIVSTALADSVPDKWLRLLLAIIIGAVLAGIMGFLIGIPVLRLRGDYLAIVTLAFGEIIKDLSTALSSASIQTDFTSYSTLRAAKTSPTSVLKRAEKPSSKAHRVRWAFSVLPPLRQALS